VIAHVQGTLHQFLPNVQNLKNAAVFWDLLPHGSCRSRRFGGSITSIIGVTRISERADSCHSDDGGDISYETSASTGATLYRIAENGILHSHCYENLISQTLIQESCLTLYNAT
jgi:hypothetical protein